MKSLNNFIFIYSELNDNIATMHPKPIKNLGKTLLSITLAIGLGISINTLAADSPLPEIVVTASRNTIAGIPDNCLDQARKFFKSKGKPYSTELGAREWFLERIDRELIDHPDQTCLNSIYDKALQDQRDYWLMISGKSNCPLKSQEARCDGVKLNLNFVSLMEKARGPRNAENTPCAPKNAAPGAAELAKVAPVIEKVAEIDLEEPPQKITQPAIDPAEIDLLNAHYKAERDRVAKEINTNTKDCKTLLERQRMVGQNFVPSKCFPAVCREELQSLLALLSQKYADLKCHAEAQSSAAQDQ